MQNISLNIPSFILGISEELEKNAKKKKRCWTGYEPVPGKKPYSEDSCRPIQSKKADAQSEIPLRPFQGVRASAEDLNHFPISLDDFMLGGGTFSMGVGGPRPSATANPAAPAVKSGPIKPPMIRPSTGKPVLPLRKRSVDLSSMPTNENIFPSSSSQLKWKYSRTPDRLRLSDGNLMYSFGFPSEFSAEDSPVERLPDEDITDFEKDVINKGTAQIHRSSPNNVYLTLADGANNPTFMLQHEKDKQWRYTPSKKFIEKINKIKENLPASQSENVDVNVPALMEATKDFEKISYYHLLQGADGAPFGHSQERLADKIQDTAQGVVNFGNSSLNFLANHPLESAFGGFLAAKGLKYVYDKYRNPEEETKPLNNTAAAAAGMVPVVASKLITGKYS
jgi:hypothetical protein